MFDYCHNGFKLTSLANSQAKDMVFFLLAVALTFLMRQD